MITPGTLLRYLIGRREAILAVAGSRGALWLGAVFVLSAALAREYDGESLLHEPWHLLIPFGASLVTSFGLYALVSAVARLRGTPDVDFWNRYRPFLTLYWMTAPLAWLYAIPVERFLSPGDATAANLWLLGLVSAWRVLLMIRVVAVVFRTGSVAATMTVLLFADAVVLVVLFLTPWPVIQFMGGVRLTESEQVVLGTKLVIGLAGFLTLPIWLIGTGETTWRARRAGKAAAPAVLPRSDVAASAWVIGIASLAVWAIVLPVTQPEQQRRWRAEQELRSGRISEALAYMSAHERGDFPPHWDPPPRIGVGDERPPLLDVLETIAVTDVPGWVRGAYLDKLRRWLGNDVSWSWEIGMDQATRERLVTVLERLPEGCAILSPHREELAHETIPDDSDSESQRALRERLRRLLRIEPPADSDAQSPAGP
jgi:hypothetical protein